MQMNGFRSLVLTAVVASAATVGYSHANVADRGAKAMAALKEEHCPFAAMRAAFAADPRGSDDRAAKTEAAFLTAFDDPWPGAAAGTTRAAAGQNCSEGDCPWAAAHAGFFASSAPGDITRPVTKTPDGVVIRISAKKPELVRTIHARFAPLFAQGVAAPRGTAGEELARK
jgi:hypothetical protein